MTALALLHGWGTGRCVHDRMQTRSNRDTMPRHQRGLVELSSRTEFARCWGVVEPKGAAPVITHPLGAIDVAQQADDRISRFSGTVPERLSAGCSPLPRLRNVGLFGSVPSSVTLWPGFFS